MNLWKSSSIETQLPHAGNVYAAIERLLNESNAIKDCAITILFKSETDLQEYYVLPPCQQRQP